MKGGIRTNKETKEMLQRQLKLLSERSELVSQNRCDESLCNLTHAMVEIIAVLREENFTIL
jgi:hypothetical protein